MNRRGFFGLLLAGIGAVMVGPVRAVRRRRGYVRLHGLGCVSSWMARDDAEAFMESDIAHMRAVMGQARIYPRREEPAWLALAVENGGTK